VFIDENDRQINYVYSSRESFELEDFLVLSVM